MEFVKKTGDYMTTRDEVMRQVATEKYRQEVERAAQAGCESSLTWHTLGVWTEEGKGRIGCFARALELLQQEKLRKPPETPMEKWSHQHTTADCLYEIGRIHAAEGSREVAKEFFARALAPARTAWQLRKTAATPAHPLDATQEDKINTALTFPEEPED